MGKAPLDWEVDSQEEESPLVVAQEQQQEKEQRHEGEQDEVAISQGKTRSFQMAPEPAHLADAQSEIKRVEQKVKSHGDDVESVDEFREVSELITRTIKPLRRQVEEELFGPLETALKKALEEVRSLRRDTLRPLDDAETRVRELLARWNRRREQERAAAEAEAEKRLAAAAQREEEAVQAGDQEAVEEARQEVDAVTSELAPEVDEDAAEGVTFQEVPKYEVVDPTLLKPKFTKPDKGKIWAVVRSLREDSVTVVSQPGKKAIRFWTEKTPVARERR